MSTARTIVIVEKCPTNTGTDRNVACLAGLIFKLSQDGKDAATITAAPGIAVFVCPECGDCFSSQGYLDKHVLDSHAHRPRGRLECAYCPYTTNKLSSMVRHEQTHTRDDSPFSCLSCNKNFMQKDSLVRHQKVHTGEKPHRCPECDQQFRESSHLAKHKERHLGGARPHACHICGLTFRLKGARTRHLKIHFGERQHACRVCGRRFTQASHARLHERRRHGGEMLSKDGAIEK